jgi:hypothetical protein
VSLLKLNKSVAIVASLTILLMSSLFGFVNLASAEPVFSLTHFEGITEGATYDVNSLSLKIEVSFNSWIYESSIYVSCYIDGKLVTQGQLTETTTGFFGTQANNYYDRTPSISSGEFVLDNLKQGAHTLQVNVLCGGTWTLIGSASESLNPTVINFNVNRHEAPKISIESLYEYPSNQASFNITTTSDLNSTVSYSLDGGENVVLNQNSKGSTSSSSSSYQVTVNGLTGGSHTVKAYATDNFGNTGTTQSSFNVKAATVTSPENSNQQPTNVSAILITVIAVIAPIILVAAIVTAMHFRHKQGKAKST